MNRNVKCPELTIDAYELIERAERAELSNRFLKNISPLTYWNKGFPTNVALEQELVRYVDSQHSNALDYYMEHDCNNLTIEEFFKVSELTKVVYDFTKEKYAKDFLVKAPIVDAAFICRIIKSIESREKITITEIGAGSGMLGAYLLNEGYKYRCIEVTQAFYLLQNRLLPWFALATDELVTDPFNDSQFTHFPYWKVWEYKNEVVDTDIFTCNHALLEMSMSAILFYLRIAKKWMEKSALGFFLVRSWGWSTLSKKEEVVSLFIDENYELVYMDNERRIALFRVIKDSKKNAINAKEVLLNELYMNETGTKMHEVLDSGERNINLDDLNKMYAEISSEQDSPDEEFTKYIL